jgi:hypothetical protein
MSATSCFRDTHFPTSLPLVLIPSLRRLRSFPYFQTLLMMFWMLESDLERALESHRTQGDCRWRIKTVLSKVKERYRPADGGLRLRVKSPSSAGSYQPD